MTPSPRAHIYRLILIIAIAVIAMMSLKDFAVPKDWDKQLWYRPTALTELQQLPTRFGGNESCKGSTCHEVTAKDSHQAKFTQLQGSFHKTLACESCHGPLTNHVKEDRKVAETNRARARHCLQCHESLPGREQKIKPFSEEFQLHKIMQVTAQKPCNDCHNPHAPK
ncbi:MAG: hypothetical protein BWK79_05555 [Beggiatoa sp. IS2]|nr:MAG: hypothetical protein BWK79_05555 [Beggiatoa sp. IS2]